MVLALPMIWASILANTPVTTPVAESPQAESEDPFVVAFDEALSIYLAGELQVARERFKALSQQPDFVLHPLRIESFVYLAEVEYYLGERDASWATCVEILRLDPDARIDPFVHPPELVAFFESVRSATKLETLPDPTPARQAVPAWAVLLPGGIQFHRDQEWIGALSLGLVISLGGTSTAMYLALRGYDTDLQRPGVQVTTPSDKARAEQLLFWTNLTRWSTATVYTASLVHGLFTSTNATATTRVSLGPNALRVEWDWP